MAPLYGNGTSSKKMGKTVGTRKQKGLRYIGEPESQRKQSYAGINVFGMRRRIVWRCRSSENQSVVGVVCRHLWEKAFGTPLRFRFEHQKNVGRQGKRLGGSR